MKHCKLRLLVWLILLPVICSGTAHAAPAVSARCGILMDAATGRILWQQRAHERSLVASTTKIMTGLLIAENCDMDDTVNIPSEAVGVEGSSLYLKEGECLTVSELLYGMMLHSGNDAAVALAIHCSGDLETFVSLMNRKAMELGMEDTLFANPHGLDHPEHYSTAYDLAVLARYAMQNSVFARVVSAKTAVFPERTFTNHNKLLWRYEGASGVKTGFTKAAGRILVSAAKRDGRSLIAVTISAPNDWQDHKRLLDLGFSDLEQKVLMQAGETLANIPVLCGSDALAQVVLKEDIMFPVRDGETVSFRCDVPVYVFAPVLRDRMAGHLTLQIDGEDVAAFPLYWKSSVMEGT